MTIKIYIWDRGVMDGKLGKWIAGKVLFFYRKLYYTTDMLRVRTVKAFHERLTCPLRINETLQMDPLLSHGKAE